VAAYTSAPPHQRAGRYTTLLDSTGPGPARVAASARVQVPQRLGHMPVQTPAGLIGSQVFRVSFDYQTALELFHQEDSGAIRVHADLTIFTRLVLRSADGRTHHLDPETSRAGLAPVIDLFGGTITGVTVDGNDTVERDLNGNPISALGTLILDFADGAQLTVPPAPIPYDSWLLDYRDLDDDEPDRRIRPRLRRIRLGRRSKGSLARTARMAPSLGHRRLKPYLDQGGFAAWRAPCCALA
jgi:hypothetical protein